MGSLRNPVGPLPSTIYWRRRAVAASLIALLALLVVWVVTSGGGDKKEDDDTSDGANPARSITPGPSGSGPAISERPGGRDDSGGTGGTDGGQGGTDAGGDGGKNGDTEGTGGSDGTGPGSGNGGNGGEGGDGTSDGAGSAGSSSGGGTGTSGGGGTGSGRQVPASSALPDCVPGSLKLALSTTKVAYEPGEKPAFRLTAENTSTTTCKADFGPKAMVLTVTDSDDDKVWSSTDCPKTGGLLIEVPAAGTITRVVEWDRRRSAPKCATPPPGGVGAGTYLVEVRASGASVKQDQQSIRLEKD